MNKIYVSSDLESLSHSAAKIFINRSKDCITTYGRFTVAISGGSTPRRLYALLASEEYSSKVEWGSVHFFWVDERCVPKGHGESNFKLVSDLLLSRISIPAENIHMIKGEDGPERGAHGYENELRRFFAKSELPTFDLIILGMGEDGHTASLFPNSPLLKETRRLAVPVFMEKPMISRISLTLPVLNNASQIIFLVAGRSKADMIWKILGAGGEKEQYPAGLIKPVRGDLLWLIDKEAATTLPY